MNDKVNDLKKKAKKCQKLNRAASFLMTAVPGMLFIAIQGMKTKCATASNSASKRWVCKTKSSMSSFPTEEEIEIKDGKRRTVERRVFPGYILVQMLLDEDSWYVVRNTPGVTGFVGMGNEPTPLTPRRSRQNYEPHGSRST
jgi:transcription antitermination factor NusG